ncbi:MAG: extracellular solute-binding protein [Pseudomonadota bacterium]|nr:extracellular solute-binding protein [Pseudomonadota bacterium]
MKPRFTVAACMLALLACLSTLVHGADAPITTYSGADRAQRLAEGARKEGELLLYTSLTVEDMAVLNAAFEKKHGIKVRMWRAAADKVLQRVVTEARGGRFDVDVIELSGPSLESLHREQLLARVDSPHQADLIPAAVPAHHEWVGSRLNVFVQAYNTKLVAKAELPKSYADLLDPRWKGKLGIESADEDWFAEVVRAMGEARGLELFRKIVATNGLSVRKGHTLLTNMVASGEVPLALTVYNFTAEQVKQKGAPLDWFVLPPAVARANGVAIARRAPHAHAAVLYYDFMIGEEGQRILAQRDFVPANRRIDTPLNKMPLRIVDPALILDESSKWTRLYDEIIVRQVRAP